MNRHQPPFAARVARSQDALQLQALVRRTERARTLSTHALSLSRDAASGSVEAGCRARGAHLRAAERLAARVPLVDQSTHVPRIGRVPHVSPPSPGRRVAPAVPSEGHIGVDAGHVIDIDQAA